MTGEFKDLSAPREARVSHAASKRVECSGPEYIGVLWELEQAGWQVSIITIVGTARYQLTAYKKGTK